MNLNVLFIETIFYTFFGILVGLFEVWKHKIYLGTVGIYLVVYVANLLVVGKYYGLALDYIFIGPICKGVFFMIGVLAGHSIYGRDFEKSIIK